MNKGDWMKQVIVMRGDLNISRGKLAAQACHGSLGAYKRADPNKIRKWEEEGEKKVILKVEDLEELFQVYEIVKRTDMAYYLVRDAGHTELPQSTITCLGIGPDEDDVVDKVTQDLKLFR